MQKQHFGLSELFTVVTQYPFQTSLHVLAFTVIYAADNITVPVLGIFGFTPIGIREGSLAARWQSSATKAGTSRVFAILESSGMGGYGVLATDVPVGLVGLAFVSWSAYRFLSGVGSATA